MGDVVGSIAGSLVGGGGTSTPSLTAYQLPQMGTLANNYAQGTQSFVNPYSQYAPEYQQVYQSEFNNPYASGQQTAANTAGTGYNTTGTQSLGASQGLSTDANQLLQNAFSPNSALYNQGLQNATNQGNVALAQNGLTNSPYGAAVQGQNLNNYNLGWEQNQLANENQALGTAGQAQTAANNLGQSGSGSILQGGTVPYNTSMGQANNQNAALGQLMAGLTGGNAITNEQLQAILPYLQLGTQQSNQQQAYNQQGYNNTMNQAQNASSFGGDLGSALGGLFGL